MIYLEDMMNVLKEEVVVVKCNDTEIWHDSLCCDREDLCTYDDFLDKYGTRVVKRVSHDFSDGMIVEVRGDK